MSRSPSARPTTGSTDTSTDSSTERRRSTLRTVTVSADMVMSLDGYIAGTDHSVANPAGHGADRIAGRDVDTPRATHLKYRVLR